MKIARELIVGLVVLLVGTVLGTAVEQHRSNESTKIRFLDLRLAPAEGLLSSARIPGKTIDVTLEGKPVANISQVTVFLYNLSDKDFESVPAYIELRAKSSAPVEVVTAYAVGSGNLPEGVGQIGNLAPGPTPGAVRYGYTIKTANRSRSDEVFRATFFVLGDVAPEAAVTVDKVGVAVRPFSYSHLTDESWWDVIAPVAVIGVFGAGYAVFLFYTFRRARKQAARAKGDLQQQIVACLVSPATRAELAVPSDLDVTRLASHITDELWKHRLEKTPKWLRPFLFGSALDKREGA